MKSVHLRFMGWCCALRANATLDKKPEYSFFT
jgi:hypothetical protein